MNEATAWIGLFHVIPLTGNDVLDGAVGAFVTVAAMAEGESHFLDIASTALHDTGFEVSSAEDVEPWIKRISSSRPEREICEMVESLSADNATAFGEFYSYDAE